MKHEQTESIQGRLSAGDETVLTELYKLFYKRLVNFSKSIVRTNELAEEVVEDVFIKLWCNRNTIAGVQNFTIYLYTAVKNKSLDTLAQKANHVVSAPFDFLDIELEDEMDSPDEILITAEMFRRMNKAVEALPPRCKMIFKLIREDGLKYKEVAEVLNISVNTIDAQMAIAVKKLCASLEVERPPKSFHFSTFQKKLFFFFNLF